MSAQTTNITHIRIELHTDAHVGPGCTFKDHTYILESGDNKKWKECTHDRCGERGKALKRAVKAAMVSEQGYAQERYLVKVNKRTELKYVRAFING